MFLKLLYILFCWVVIIIIVAVAVAVDNNVFRVALCYNNVVKLFHNHDNSLCPSLSLHNFKRHKCKLHY